MDSPNSPVDEPSQAQTPQPSGSGGGSANGSADPKPSQTSSILKERRFKLSR